MAKWRVYAWCLACLALWIMIVPSVGAQERHELPQPVAIRESAQDDFPGDPIGVLANYTQDVASATVLVTDPVFSCVGSQGYHSVWFRFVPFSDMTITVDSSDSDYDAVIGVFSGSYVALNELACAYDYDVNVSRISLSVLANETYYVSVAALYDEQPSYQLVFDFIAPAHDRLQEFFVISNTSPTPVVSDDVASATYNLDNLPASCLSSATQTLWYQYTPLIDGWYQISNQYSTSTFSTSDTVLALYTGTPGALVEMACADEWTGVGDPSNHEAIQFWGEAGTDYYIMSGDFGTFGDTSLMVLDIYIYQTPAPFWYAPASLTTTTTPTFTWTSLGTQVSSYYLQVYGQSQYGMNNAILYEAIIGLDDPNLACDFELCHFVLPLELPVGDHLATVAGMNVAGYGLGAELSFTVGLPPQTPVVYAPVGWITDTLPYFELGYYPHNHWYQVWLNDMTGVVFADWYWTGSLACDGGICIVPSPVTLSPGLHQFWTQSWNLPGGYSAWSSTTYFGVALTPNQPTAISPVGTISDNTPTFTWNWDQNDHWYYLWVAGGSYSSDVWYNAFSICSGGICEVTPGVVLADGSYTWWLQAWSPAGYGAWNAGVNFVLDSTPNVTTAPAVEVAPVIVPAVEVEPIQIELP